MALKKKRVSFPRSEHRDHADQRAVRRAGWNWKHCFRPVRSKPLQVDAGRHGGDTACRQTEQSLEFIGDRDAGGHHMIRQRREGVTADARVRVIDVDMAGPDDEGDPRQPSRKAEQPAIAGAVRIQNLGSGFCEAIPQTSRYSAATVVWKNRRRQPVRRPVVHAHRILLRSGARSQTGHPRLWNPVNSASTRCSCPPHPSEASE